MGAILIALCGCGVPDRDAAHLASVWDTVLRRLDEHNIVRIRVRAQSAAGHTLEFETGDSKTIAACVEATHHVVPVPDRQFNQPDSIQFVDGRGNKTQMHINFFNGRHDLGPRMEACFNGLARFPVE
ncbi:hypothetical protein [Fimbriimonas ginsengisoli]|uniref:hypothetical protein n=1 Tax=Fimbriimonas ginsengisoli TaxID=1005039 RepID=UPI001185BBF7|nr:hypothetical protein [Fimbriimonas ginsengisoli]